MILRTTILLLVVLTGCQSLPEEPDLAPAHKDGRIEQVVYQGLLDQQLSNGLLESTPGANFVSTYDNALACLVFTFGGNYSAAAEILEFFRLRIDTELLTGPGGFGQFRDAAGIPLGSGPHRWLGDNAWLLLAVHVYQHTTGDDRFDRLASELELWIRSLQQPNGSLIGGYDAWSNPIPVISEGNLDAFHAVPGYDLFHTNLLQYLKNYRWDHSVKAFIADPANPSYRFALDLHSWGYGMLPGAKATLLDDADRFLTKATATVTGKSIRGYCFDEDRDVVWLEGTGQMALAFKLAGRGAMAEELLYAMEKTFFDLGTHPPGFPYASNQGTSFGAGPLWVGVDTQPALSGAAWYLLARGGHDIFKLGRGKPVPPADRFWRF